jgi:NAD(P)-dependent dehydrogenase (short-subunit alcohol dehydrogenase family)
MQTNQRAVFSCRNKEKITMPKDNNINSHQYLPNNSTRQHSYKRWILVTGATDGIGRQLAQALASNSADNFVIVHGRTAKNCQIVVDSLMGLEQRKQTKKTQQSPTAGGPSQMSPKSQQWTTNVDYVAADFSKLIEVLKEI